MGETYYEVLGVDPDATRDDIESAYRDRVLETHPDHSDAPDAAEQFKRVTTAKSVLTDDAERARYDRLGHDAYVGLARNGGGESPETASNGSTQSTSDRRTNTGTTAGTRQRQSTAETETASAATGSHKASTSHQTSEEQRTNGETGPNRTSRTDSHHARQRSRRHRRQRRRQTADEWPFDNTADQTGNRRQTTTSAGPTAATEAAESDDKTEVQYSVHDWDDAVDLEWEGPPITQRTILSVGAVALLYPLLVTASLTPLFSLPVNAVVAACTLALIGYLLTMPRLATAAFGLWSVGFPIGLVAMPSIEPVSVFGLLTIGFAWVPLGYAVVLWWVLRP